MIILFLFHPISYFKVPFTITEEYFQEKNSKLIFLN